MHKIIDARGRSCPEPVLMTKEALSEWNGTPIDVVVDMMVAVENIKRFASNQGYKVSFLEESGEYTIHIDK